VTKGYEIDFIPSIVALVNYMESAPASGTLCSMLLLLSIALPALDNLGSGRLKVVWCHFRPKKWKVLFLKCPKVVVAAFFVSRFFR
jgi:hypothetical protein